MLSLLDPAHDQRGSKFQPENDLVGTENILICAGMRFMKLFLSKTSDVIRIKELNPT